MLGLLAFIVITQGVLILGLHLSSIFIGLPELNFVSDYFFYSLVLQWSLATLLMVSSPSNQRHMKYSASKATKVAASMAEEPETDHLLQGINGNLGVKLYLSGAVSLLVCFLL
ncbi:hypothetical protein [Vibrio sp. SCSIO 43136]|uniref:hypothetical protein n=1 Tax=Vibrio sp. SCSIO 43136 TaxID=2819101 RepID=UPI0020755450|nr:hypothetical protein [Vibrio sp. SCSIO 43136]USD64047.1 hypothetical protein J4N39_07890 [Vibrio sp. SCSIO 43136]